MSLSFHWFLPTNGDSPLHHWFGEGVLPILRDRGLWAHPDARE
jgi:hypothetical protein